jgi:hypothetical protein
MRAGRIYGVLALAPALLATLLAVVAFSDTRNEAAAATGGFHPPQTAAQARRAALADARERLAKVVPPPGATRIHGAPAGTHLADPPSRIERGRPIDLARFWQTGESPAQVLRWFRLHHPGGSFLDDEGPLLFDGVAVRHVYSFEFGELAPIASSRSVLVTVVPVTEGTVIRVDSQDAWEVPHPRAERIPPNAGFAKLERIIYRPKQKTMVKLHGRRVHAVAELINDLPIVGPRAGGHEERLTGELKITFRSREGGRELASVRYQETVHFGYSVEVTVPKKNHSNFVDHWGGHRLVRGLEPYFAGLGHVRSRTTA